MKERSLLSSKGSDIHGTVTSPIVTLLLTYQDNEVGSVETGHRNGYLAGRRGQGKCEIQRTLGEMS